MAYAASYSDFNYVNQEMVPLSKVREDLLLLHESYCTYLEKDDKAIDENLKRENFKVAG